ncbi:MAG TPA: zonular occludens toxin domain-containing protein [Tepidisphaeraceae bacterium]|nr:zonular occludens toxin domain-containing protein [Tepidisphaeraceae bacterium]
MIYVVGGDLGSGKSLWSMDMMQIAARMGRPIYTNINLLPACPFHDRVALIDTPEWPVFRERKTENEVCAWWEYAVDGALIVVDEADLYFDCTDNSKMGKDARAAHKMIRKVGWDIIYIVQNVPNLYVRIRRLASRFIICEHTYRTLRVFRWIELALGKQRALSLSRFIRAEFGSEKLEPGSHRGDGYYSYNEASVFFGWYETKQLLGDFNFYRQRHAENLQKTMEEARAVVDQLDPSERREVLKVGACDVEPSDVGEAGRAAGLP